MLGLAVLASVSASNTGAKGETIIDVDRIVNSGEQVTDDIIRIGEEANTTVTVTGVNADLSATDSLHLGGVDAITGRLIIQNGGTASAPTAEIGVEGDGHVTVTGAQSRFEVSDVAYVATEATSSGSLTVSAAGYVTVGTIHVGNRGEGTATVTGEDSRLEATDTIYIGTYEGATGALIVEAGGSVESKRAVIAESGEGSATVSGEGSNWTIAEDLILATRTGGGTLTIEDGGFVAADAVTFGEIGADVGAGHILLGGGSGGILETGQVQRVDGDAEFVMDSGTLRLTRDQDSLFDGMDEVVLGPGGGIFDTQSFAVTTVTSLTGAGGLEKIGAGTLTLGAPATYSGDTRITAGTLAAGAANVLATGATHRIAADGTLLLNGFDQTISHLENGGALNFGGTAPGTVLTVLKDYAGQDGVIYFKTQLGDDASPTDLLVVQGIASGATTVRVVNVGGSGHRPSAASSSSTSRDSRPLPSRLPATTSMRASRPSLPAPMPIGSIRAARLWRMSRTGSCVRSGSMATPAIRWGWRVMRPIRSCCWGSMACRRSSSGSATASGLPHRAPSGAVLKALMTA
jgi:autotransporter-associated beta strand protein/T5SS/PEP-CTERM-associated repeat protein